MNIQIHTYIVDSENRHTVIHIHKNRCLHWYTHKNSIWLPSPSSTSLTPTEVSVPSDPVLFLPNFPLTPDLSGPMPA